MRILIIHQNFPGQFRHVAQTWAQRPGWQVLGLGRDTAPGLPGVTWLKYRLHRTAGSAQHPYLRKIEDAVLHGQAVARALHQLKQRGFVPDLVLAHPGWGETLYLGDVFPAARLIHLCEWYYDPAGADMGFDPEFAPSLDDRARVRTWNALHALNLTVCHAGISPTAWQRERHPAIFRAKIAQIHEGIATDQLGPDPGARLELGNGVTVRAGDPVITYVARNLEPYRGIHSFLRALEIVQRRHPSCQTLIVGGDEVSYGRPPADAPHWRAKLLREVRLDPARTHFLGKLPYAGYRRVLQVSAAHVYLSYPFVLSWSMLEAMASACLVIGSDTPPVREVLRDGVNGRLVSFFDLPDIADRVLDALAEPAAHAPLRQRARQDVIEQYSRAAGLAGYDRLVQAVMAGTWPPMPTAAV